MFNDALGKRRGAARNYRVLSVVEIQDFDLPPLDPDCLLFLWKVSAMPQEALDVVAAWGFEPKSEIVWEKDTKLGNQHFGMGRYTRNCHETALICTRGAPKIQSRSERSSFRAPVGRHSEKPDRFYEIVERMAAGPYVELFARRRRDNWICFGDELPPVSKGAA